jgi:NADH-quinone oxidoreductase subunit K
MRTRARSSGAARDSPQPDTASSALREPGGGTVSGPGIPFYLAVSGILFSIGAMGVLLRRSVLIVLLSLELMLNASNLAFVAFSRLFGQMDGQVFALAVMAVAAAEVTVGLGLIVAISRRKLSLDVDSFSELHG